MVPEFDKKRRAGKSEVVLIEILLVLPLGELRAILKSSHLEEFKSQ